jgi:hypothetical protein
MEKLRLTCASRLKVRIYVFGRPQNPSAAILATESKRAMIAPRGKSLILFQYPLYQR